MAEKAPKGVLAAHNVAFPRSHSIGLLLDLVKTTEVEIPKELSKAKQLTIFAIQARYPGAHIAEFDEYGEAVAIAEKVIRWAEKHVKRFTDNK